MTVGQVQVKVTERRIFDIQFADGKVQTVSEEEARKIFEGLSPLMLRGLEVVSPAMTSYLYNGNGTLAGSSSVRFSYRTPKKLEELSTYKEAVRRDPFPKGYLEIGRGSPDEQSHNRNSVFVYGEDIDGKIVFRVINGKIYPLQTLGKLSDPESLVRRFLDRFPKGTTVIKQRFYDMLWCQDWINGRLLKALLDVLVIKGYVEEVKPLYEHGKRVVGYRLKEHRGLGVASTQDLMVREPPKPTTGV